MVRIILLTDRERLARLFSGAGAVPSAEIFVVAAVEDALKAITEAPPDFVFIQERIGEVSGDVLVHRLGTGMKGRKTRFVLIGDSSASDVSAGKHQRLLLNEAMSDEEITEAFRQAVSSAAKVTRKRRRPSANAHPNGSTAASPPPLPPLPAVDVSDIVELGVKAPPTEAGPVQLPDVSSPDEAPSVKPSFQDRLEKALKSLSPAPKGAHGEIAPRLTGKTRRMALVLSALAGLGLLLVLAIALPGKRQPAGNQGEKSGQGTAGDGSAPSPIPAPVLRALPSFIPHQDRDAGYGATHPGWELYRSPAAEFRVYREQGVIRAIQVIDRGEEGIAPALFESALRELAGYGRYLVESRERKGPYLIEKGRLRSGAGIIVYLREPQRKVKAFVIDLRS